MVAQNVPTMTAAVRALTILLRRNDARPMFGARHGINYLTKLLKSQGSMSNAQLLYELTFCLWALSFCDEIRPAFLEHHTIEVLVEQVTAAPREKVVRVVAQVPVARRRADDEGQRVAGDHVRPGSVMQPALEELK